MWHSKLHVEYTPEAWPTCHDIACICWNERGKARKIPWAISKYYPAIPAHQEPSWTASKYQQYPSNSIIGPCLIFVKDMKPELFTSTRRLIFPAPYHCCYNENSLLPSNKWQWNFKLFNLQFIIPCTNIVHANLILLIPCIFLTTNHMHWWVTECTGLSIFIPT